MRISQQSVKEGSRNQQEDRYSYDLDMQKCKTGKDDWGMASKVLTQSRIKRTLITSKPITSAG
jgi:hypothetical protein